MVRGRKGDNSKTPTPCRQNRMLHSINHRQDSTVCEIIILKSAVLPFDKLNMGNIDLSTNSIYYNHSNTNFPLHNTLNQVDSNTDLIDEVILTEVVLRPTKKPRSVGPHKLISKKNGNKRKSRLGDKKFRSVSKLLYGVHANLNSKNGLKSTRPLLYKSKDKNDYPLRNTNTPIPIVGRKITIIVSDVHACISYIITRMESLSLCHRKDHLQIDVLSVKKLRLFLLSSIEEHCVHLKSLFLKHTIYLSKICQQIIQSQRFKKAFITLKRVTKYVIKWLDSDPYFILTKYKFMNQGLKTNNNQYYDTHQKSILSNTVTESDIYNNYSYTSCVNWEIEKTSETPSKKIEFYIDNPETGLKKTDFNIITNNDEINDMNDDKMDFRSDNPTNDVYSTIDHKNVQQERTIHNSLYHLVNSELQLNYDIEESYRTDDWKSTDSHNGELVIAYDDKIGNKTLHPRVFYTLYIRPNDIGIGHLIYKFSTDQILITKDYQPVPVSNDLIKAMDKTNPCHNKIQVMHLKDDHSTVQDNHSNNHNEEYYTPINNTNDREDKNQDESDCSLHLNNTESNKTVDQGYKILLPVGQTKSTSISAKHNKITNTSTFPQDIPCHPYKGISTIVHLLLSLLVSLPNGILQSSLLVSLQSTICTYRSTIMWMFLFYERADQNTSRSLCNECFG